MFKVLTREVIFEGKKFVLVSDKSDGRTWYGTIPFEEVDSTGHLKRELNGIQMMVSFENAAEALKTRHTNLVLDRLIKGFEAKGMDWEDAFFAAAKTDEYKQIRALYA